MLTVCFLKRPSGRLWPRLCENTRTLRDSGSATLISLNVAQGVVVDASQWQRHRGCVEKSNRAPEFSHSLGRFRPVSGQELSTRSRLNYLHIKVLSFNLPSSAEYSRNVRIPKFMP